MNLILLFPEDFSGSSRVRLSDYRADHIKEIHRADVGKTLKVGRVNGGVGEGTVVSLDGGSVVLDVRIPDMVPEPPLTSLILALPRPQTLKKVLETVGAFGIRRLFLVNTGRVQKSFFGSKLLKDQAWMRHLRLGLEQGSRTFLPDITVEPSLREFLPVLDEPAFAKSVRLIAHPSGEASLWDASLKPGAETLCALGPEGGWLDREVDSFKERGFLPIRLGNTIHRVENAVTALLAQIELLRLKPD